MKRVYGRVNQINGRGGQWVVITTDENGDDSNVYLTALVQCLKLDRNESPFYAGFGIPARQSVITQVIPDWYVAQTQKQYAPYFASLTITRVPGSNSLPTYHVVAVTTAGATLERTIPT